MICIFVNTKVNFFIISHNQTKPKDALVASWLFDPTMQGSLECTSTFISKHYSPISHWSFLIIFCVIIRKKPPIKLIKLIYKDHVILSNFSEICYLKIKKIELIYSVILSNFSMGWLYNIDTWYVYFKLKV
jgi:hypothetical protein